MNVCGRWGGGALSSILVYSRLMMVVVVVNWMSVMCQRRRDAVSYVCVYRRRRGVCQRLGGEQRRRRRQERTAPAKGSSQPLCLESFCTTERDKPTARRGTHLSSLSLLSSQKLPATRGQTRAFVPCLAGSGALAAREAVQKKGKRVKKAKSTGPGGGREERGGRAGAELVCESVRATACNLGYDNVLPYFGTRAVEGDGVRNEHAEIQNTCGCARQRERCCGRTLCRWICSLALPDRCGGGGGGCGCGRGGGTGAQGVCKGGCAKLAELGHALGVIPKDRPNGSSGR